jgi:CubicO group peptidase (beta-lactamase class C family)
VRRLAEAPLGAVPGESWASCKQNFILAGYHAERRLGRSWEGLVRAEVFEPLGLRSAGVGHAALRRSDDFAGPHLLDAREGIVPIEFETHLEPWGPSGAIHASASDMARYLLFQVGDGTFEGRPFLSKELLEEMRRPHVSVAGTPRGRERSREMLVTEMGYALGWYTESYRGLRLVEHEGTLDGFTAGVTLVPLAAFGMALLTNAHHAQPFLRTARLLFLERFLGLEPEPDLEARIDARAGFDPIALRERLAAARVYEADPASFEPLVGDYEPPSPGAPVVSVSRDRAKLFLTVGGQLTFDLVPDAPKRFLTNGRQVGVRPLSFDVDEAGTVTLLGGDEVLGRERGR